MSDDLSGKISLDTADFKNGIATMNRELRVLESGFRASAAGLGDWAKDATGLEMRMKSLSAQIDVQKSKVSALEGEYKRVAAEKGANSIAAQNLLIKLNKETETLGKMESELGKTEKALSEMGDETGKAGKETDKLEKEEGQATGATRKFADALNGLKDKLHAGVSGLGKMVVGVGKLAAGMAVGLAAGAAAAVAGVGALVVKTAAASDELVETAEKMGITTTKLQELNYIAEQTGTGVDTMQTALSRMTRSLDDVEKEGTPAQMAFEKLGVSVRDSSGQFRDNKDILFESIAALGEVENATERDALAMELFGRSALELNPLINLGAEGMAAMAGEAHALGAVMSEESVTGMADLNDALAGLKAGFMGMVGTLATAFLPILNDVVAFIQTSVIPWLQENLPKAIQVLSDYWTNTLQPAIAAVWAYVRNNFIPILFAVYDWLTVNIPEAIAVAGEWLGKLRDWWQEHGGEIIATAKEMWATITNSIAEFIAWASPIISDFLAAVNVFWDKHGAAITTEVKWIYDEITASQKAYQEWALPIINGFLESVLGYWAAHGDGIIAAVKAMWDGVKLVWETFKAAWANLIELFHLAQEGKWYEFGEKLRSILDAAWAAIKEAAQKAIQAIKDFFTETDWGAVGEGILRGIGNGLTAGLSWLKEMAIKAAKAALDAAKGFLGIESPSRVFAEVGENMMKGMAMGIAQSSQLPAMAAIGAASRSVQTVNNYYAPLSSYSIQAANPLQSSDDLVRQVRLLELMHG